MAKLQKRYAREFRRQMVELHRAGRTFHELSKEFGCSFLGDSVLGQAG